MTELLGGGRATEKQPDSDTWFEPDEILDDVDAAAAEATALAARARARADRLHRRASDADSECGETHRRVWRGLTCAAVAVLLIVAAGAATGYMVWQHRATARDRQLTAEFAAAARQSVVTLMSMNFQTAKQDVQRVVDDSTGEFHDDFVKTADDFIKVLQDSKVVTTAQVNQTAVQSKTTDSATVLVAATSEITNTAGAHQDPRAWRWSSRWPVTGVGSRCRRWSSYRDRSRGQSNPVEEQTALGRGACRLLVASYGGVSWLYFAIYRHDQQSSPSVADAVVKAAASGTVAVLSYKPDTAQSDFATARSRLTGDFLTYYDQFTGQVVGPAVTQKGVRTAAAVVQAAITNLQPDSAAVLLFVNQTTASGQNPQPSMTASSVNVGLRKVGGNWLISSFDPV